MYVCLYHDPFITHCTLCDDSTCIVHVHVCYINILFFLMYMYVPSVFLYSLYLHVSLSYLSSYLLSLLILRIAQHGSVNKMDSHNLAIIFAPSLLQHPDTSNPDQLLKMMPKQTKLVISTCTTHIHLMYMYNVHRNSLFCISLTIICPFRNINTQILFKNNANKCVHACTVHVQL